MSKDDHSGSKINVGNIENSTGIVIGDRSSAVVNQARPPMQAEVIELLNDFIGSLGAYGDSLSDADDVRESAVAARAEAEEPSPRWSAVRGLLKGITASVASIAALTDAINNIQALVARIAS